MPTDGSGNIPVPSLTVTADQAYRSAELLAESQPGYPAAQISIRRVTAGYSTVLVRGARAANSTGGTLYTYDHEPPLGLTSEYQAKAHYSDGDISAWSAPVAVAIGCDPNEVWIKDAGQPLRSTRFVLRELGGRRREARRELHRVAGRTRVVAISDVRSGASEQIVIGTRTHSEKNRLDVLLDSGQVLLLQTPPNWGRRDAFQSFGNSEEIRLRQYGPEQHRDWRIEIDESDEPGFDRTGVADNNYSTLPATFDSYASLPAERATYLSLLAGSSRVQ